MLLERSIFLQVCLVISVRQIVCQDYESSYSVDEGPDDHSSIEEESGHPDYSKYYSVDTSAPLVAGVGNTQSGFSAPIEFSGFFGPSPLEFGASGKNEVKQIRNPFVVDPKAAAFTDSTNQLLQFYSSNYPRDYFEEAQQKQQQEEAGDESRLSFAPGPNYIAHKVPATNYNLDTEYSSDVETVDKPEKKSSKKKDYDEDSAKDYSAESEANKEYKTPDYTYDYVAPTSGKYTDYNVGKSSSTVAQHPHAQGFKTTAKTPYQKYSFQPVATENYQSKFLDSLISTVAPFNPAYNKIATTVATPAFESQSSENIPAHLAGKGCVKVKKAIEGDRQKREAMDCYVCEDPKTTSKYTQCSYNVEPEPTNYYAATSQRFSTPAQEPDGFRYKRYSGDDANADPYEYIKRRSQAAYEPYESRQHESKEDNDEYKYVPDYYTDTSPDEKSFSESQSAEIAKNPQNCVKSEKDGMTCTVCKDPKTGGNYEQCSYTTAPKEQKYAYVTEKKYDSNEPEESKPEAKTESISSEKVPEKDDKQEVYDLHAPQKEEEGEKSYEKSKKDYYDQETPEQTKSQPKYEDADEKTSYGTKTSKTRPSKIKSYKDKSYQDKADYKSHVEFDPKKEFYDQGPSSEQSKTKSTYEDPLEAFSYGVKPKKSNKPKKLVEDDPYEVPKHFAESTLNERKSEDRKSDKSYEGDDEGDEASAEAAEEEEEEEVSPYKDIDEYHFKLFPEFTNEESQQAAVVAGTGPDAEETRKDVEEVLAEFSKKDRTKCKKAEKKGMTCYLCVDDKGIQHEECMYVSESKPKASHVAYHEVKQIKTPEKTEETAASEPKERKRFFKKVTTTATPAFTLETAASEEVESRVEYKPKKSRSKKSKKSKKDKEDVTGRLPYDEAEPTRETPQEFIVGEKEGAFSAETKPVYSKALGVTLPRYMLEKSEFEKEFDDFSGNKY